MKVLHVFKDYCPPSRGGIELHIRDLAHSMDGVRSEVLTSSRSRRRVEEADGSVRVVRVPEYARPTSTPVTPAWSRHMRETDADLIHFHMPNPFGELTLLSSRTRVPVIVSYHADIVGRSGVLPLYLPFQQRALRRASRVVVASPAMLDAERVRPHRARAICIPYGVDVPAWSVRPAEADAIRARYPGPIVLFLGRLAYYKGLDVLLQAMRSVDATLIVAGSGPKGGELRALARTLGVDGRVAFVGEVEDRSRAAYYHAADVFAFPGTSRAEAFGIAMLEAMACGTPAVSTELGTGTSWVNQHGETGTVVRAGDAAALAGAIDDLLGDPDGAARKGAAARRRAAERFDRRAMLEALTDLYRSVA